MWDHTLNDWRWALGVNVWGDHPRHQGVRARRCSTAASPATSSTPARATAASPRCRARRSTRSRSRRSSRSPSRSTRSSQQVGAPIGASVLFPGPNVLRTGLFNSGRNRPDELAEPRRGPPHRIDRDVREDPGRPRHRPRLHAGRGGRGTGRRRGPQRHVLDPPAERAQRRADHRAGAVDAHPHQPHLHPRPGSLTDDRERPLPRHLQRLPRRPARTRSTASGSTPSTATRSTSSLADRARMLRARLQRASSTRSSPRSGSGRTRRASRAAGTRPGATRSSTPTAWSAR